MRILLIPGYGYDWIEAEAWSVRRYLKITQFKDPYFSQDVCELGCAWKER